MEPQKVFHCAFNETRKRSTTFETLPARVAKQRPGPSGRNKKRRQKTNDGAKRSINRPRRNLIGRQRSTQSKNPESILNENGIDTEQKSILNEYGIDTEQKSTSSLGMQINRLQPGIDT